MGASESTESSNGVASWWTWMMDSNADEKTTPMGATPVRVIEAPKSQGSTVASSATASGPGSAASGSATSTTSSPVSDRSWIYSPRYGIPVPRNLPEYTYEEVISHSQPSSYWIVMDSHVYDFTQYHWRHPGGGIEKLFQYGEGTDRGEAFYETHNQNLKYAAQQFLIGRIKEGSPPSKVEKERPQPTLLQRQREQQHYQQQEKEKIRQLQLLEQKTQQEQQQPGQPRHESTEKQCESCCKCE